MYRTSFSQNRRVELRIEGLEERCLLSSAEYVAGLYNGILHRSPAPAEVAGWVDALAAGASPHDVARGFTGTGVTIVTDSGQSDGSSYDPGTDSSGFDTTGTGGYDGTFDGAASDGGNDVNQAPPSDDGNYA